MRENTKAMLYRSGYVTVFFAMIFLAVTALVLSALEAVRAGGVRLQAEIAAGLAAEAFLSQYQTQVQTRYGLYMLERDGYDLLFLQEYIRVNCAETSAQEDSAQWFASALEAVAIGEELTVDEEEYAYLKQQITELMEVTKGMEYAQSIFAKLLGISSADVDGQAQNLVEDLTQAAGEAQEEEERLAQEALSEEEAQVSETEEEQETEDPREGITHLLAWPLLTLIMDDVSDSELDTSQLSSQVQAEEAVSQLSDFMDNLSVTNSLSDISFDLSDTLTKLTDSFLLDCYIVDYFKNAVQQDIVEEETVLNYEAEYILAGNEEDSRNLSDVMNRLCFLRMLLNMTYLVQSSEKTTAARSAAAAVAAATLMPYMEEVYYLLILAAWSYAEAIVDCRSLVQGGEVPLLKDDSSWKLSLQKLTKISMEEIKTLAGTDSDSAGLSYAEYLQILLLTTDEEKKCLRMLNLIEANVRLEEGCESFQLSDCVVGVTIYADFVFEPYFYQGSPAPDRYTHHVTVEAAY